MNRRDFIKACGHCLLLGAALTPAIWGQGGARASPRVERGYLGHRLSPFFEPLEGGIVRCTLCPHGCEVDEGERGFCGVRQNIGGRYYTLVYGNPCAVHIDPIEKKPFFHVLPGSSSFSLATAGCNFRCKFCQNWEISQTTPDKTLNYHLGPEEVVSLARRSDCASIASTYVEPVIFTEYMLDIGKLARPRGILKVMHSNGFVNPGPLRNLLQHLDAACIDLKGFTGDYYREMTGGELQPVLETLRQIRAAHVHLEIVNLVIPGHNDQPESVAAMCRWILEALGPDCPLHFTRFYPMYKMKSLPPTPVATLERARQTALEQGLHFVYLGNVPGHPAENTYCPQCGAIVVHRSGYRVRLGTLQQGKCGKCGMVIPGIWGRPAAPKRATAA